MEFLQQITVLAGFFLVLGCLIWALQRKGLARFNFPIRKSSRVRRMKSLERLPLTPQHSLHLVEIDGRVLVVGLSPSGCQLVTSTEPHAGSQR